MADEFNLEKIPKKHLSEVEKQYIQLKIEQLRMKRENNRIILEKGILLFFAYMIFSMLAYNRGLVSEEVFNLLIKGSVVVLLVSVTPYLLGAKKQEKELDKLLSGLIGSTEEK